MVPERKSSAWENKSEFRKKGFGKPQKKLLERQGANAKKDKLKRKRGARRKSESMSFGRRQECGWNSNEGGKKASKSILKRRSRRPLRNGLKKNAHEKKKKDRSRNSEAADGRTGASRCGTAVTNVGARRRGRKKVPEKGSHQKSEKKKMYEKCVRKARRWA